MTLDELERCDRYLRQGLDLDRETTRKLLDFALQHAPRRKHLDGCGWWRGAGCTCQRGKR